MFKGHPKGLFVAFFSNMGERFGFYTMMAILVLFLQARYGLSEEDAGNYYSWFYFGIYALALVGGILADVSRKYIRQPELFPTTQKHGQNPHIPPILRGDRNRGHWQGFRQPFSHFFGWNLCQKNRARKSPLNCRLKSRLKPLFSKNNRFKRYFPWAWTPLPLEPENWIRKKAIGARIEPGIDHLFGALTEPATYPDSPTWSQ